MAIEGMHRLQAACELGIAPILDVLGQNDIIDVSQMDIGYMFWPDCKYTAGEIAYECCGVGAGCYRINNDGTLTLVYESLISVC
ncbi:MAG: hypothetical protein JXK05_09680 [Campylobacterales bacterium]|nr:hypothetical protein [Campylobacterales bacterium]